MTLNPRTKVGAAATVAVALVGFMVDTTSRLSGLDTKIESSLGELDAKVDSMIEAEKHKQETGNLNMRLWIEQTKSRNPDWVPAPWPED